MRCVVLFWLAAIPGLCEPISAGVKAGVPLDRAGQGDTNTEINKQRWTVGPTVEFALPAGLAIGVDALYRRLGYRTVRNVGSASFFEDSRTSHWEFPLYAKYRFGGRSMRPFVLAGGALEHASVSGSGGCTGDPMLCGSSGATVYELKSTSWGGGYLVGGGVEFTLGILKIAPEFRYTRWVRGYFSGAGADQPALLLGIRF
jgi:hypothetical protein